MSERTIATKTAGQWLVLQPREFGSTGHKQTEIYTHQHRGRGFTTKHTYFSGAKRKFRVRYDRIVDFEPFSDGFEIMRDGQTAKPQSFRTGDGWFAYNLAVNLARI